MHYSLGKRHVCDDHISQLDHMMEIHMLLYIITVGVMEIVIFILGTMLALTLIVLVHILLT